MNKKFHERKHKMNDLDRKQAHLILEELVAQEIDEETNNNNLGWLLGAERPLTEKQEKQANISKLYKNKNKEMKDNAKT